MSFPRYPEHCCNRVYHFAGAGKMIAGGKGTAPKMELGEKDAGRLPGEAKADIETKDK